MREKAEKIRRILLTVDNVSKVELVGEQPEKIYIEASLDKLSELGISPQDIMQAVQTQQQMAPAGHELKLRRIMYILRLSGQFADVDMLKEMPINAGG